MKSPILSSALKAICLTALLAVFCPAAEAADVRVGKERFNPSDSLDASYGLAGAFIGKIGSQVVLAGGSNFSKGMPWEGGAKQFSDRIHLISEKDGVLHTSLVSGNSLPTGTAHGCSATIGHTLFCFGGQTSEGASDKVLAIDEANGSVAVRTIGSLPSGLNPVAALAIKNDIFIHGISSEKNRLVKFTPATGGWKELTPCPGGPVSAGPSFEPQHNGSENAFYLIGGRHEGKETTTVHSDVWEYLPTSDTWSRKGDVTIGSRTVPIMFAASTPFGSGHILLIGGDTGEEFLRRDSLSRALGRARTETEKAAISNELREAFIGNKGFSKNILAYHTITNTWNLLSECDHSLPAVSTAVALGDGIIIPSGELKPGVRSTDIERISIRENPKFGAVNYLVLFAYLLGMMCIGLYFARKNDTTDQFFKGGARIPWWAAGISIFATALSAITFLSIPAKAYGADWGMFMFNMAILLIVPIVIRFYLPFFRKLEVASAYQYLEQRFSAPVRLLASTFFSLFMLVRVAIVLFLPSLALNAVTGIDIYLCIILMGVVTILYSTMGGIEAVVWADVIQGIVLVGGAVISLFFLIGGIDGGFTGMIRTAIADDKLNIIDTAFDWSKPVLWVALLGGISNQLISYTSDQSVIQRYITVKDTEGTRKGIWLNGVISVPITLIFFTIGTALYVFFKQNPELQNVGMSNTDSIFPYFIMSELPVGIAGLLVAAIFSAAMSTLSANINSTSTVLTEDFFKRFRRGVTEGQAMSFARWSSALVGGLGLSVAVLLATFDIASLWDQFNFFLGLLTSGLGGLFMVGIFIKRVGTRSVLTGFAGSLIVILALNSCSTVSFLLYGFVGLVSCCAISYLSSFIYGKGR